jgi:hypothetical protein
MSALDPTRDQADRWAARSVMSIEMASRNLAETARELLEEAAQLGDQTRSYRDGVLDLVRRSTGKDLDDIPKYDGEEIRAMARQAGAEAAAEWDAAHRKK